MGGEGGKKSKTEPTPTMKCHCWQLMQNHGPHLLSLHTDGLGSETVSVAEEQDAFASTLSISAGLDPLAPASTLPKSADKSYRAVFGLGSIVLAHDRLDGLGCFISVVERNGANVVVENMRLDNAVEKVAADEAHFAVNGGSRPANKVPLVGSVVRQSRVGMLKEGNGDWMEQGQCQYAKASHSLGGQGKRKERGKENGQQGRGSRQNNPSWLCIKTYRASGSPRDKGQSTRQPC